jgi:hypothetical protein
LKKLVWQFVKWLAALLILGLIVWFNREQLAKISEQTFDVRYLLLAGAIYLPSLVLTFYRWFLLVRAQELPFRELDALRLGFIGNFFNQFLPGSVGGDLLKAGFLIREQKRRAVAVATVIVDRLVGLFGLMLLASLCGLFFYERTSQVEKLNVLIIFVWSVTLAGLGVLVLPIRFTRLINWLKGKRKIGLVLAEVLGAVELYRRRPRALATAVVLAVVAHVGFVLAYYFGACSVLAEVPTPPPADHYMIIPVGMVVKAVPITPGNLGVGETAFGYLYDLVGSTWLKGALSLIAQRIVEMAIALIGLIFYIPLRGTVREVIAQESAAEIQIPEVTP